jgi:hypothetical protein
MSWIIPLLAVSFAWRGAWIETSNRGCLALRRQRSPRALRGWIETLWAASMLWLTLVGLGALHGAWIETL